MSMGEPQWIVTNREDGTNVNGWHWVEKDCFHWIENRIGEKVPGAVLGDTGVTIEATGTSVTGEATANNRRGKTIFLYELKVTSKWRKAGTAADEKAVEGTITFPYVGDDNEDEKWDVEVRCTNKSVVGSKVADDTEFEIRRKAAPLLEKIIRECLDAMKEHFSASHKPCGNTTPSLAPPVADYSQQQQQQQPKKSTESTKKSTEIKEKSTESKEVSTGGAHVEMTEKFATANPKEIYDLILDEGRMSVVAGKAKIEKTMGGKFSLFDGAVTGVFVELVSGKKIVEKWRFSSWEKDHYSLVTITLAEKNGKTILTLKQDGVPPDDLERTQKGWKTNIWERMKVIFGYGSISL